MKPVSVITFNLKVSGFEERKGYIRELLSRCVQELKDTYYEEFKKMLPQYNSVGEPRRSIFNNELCAIFYNSRRFILRESETIWLSNKPERKGSKFLFSFFPRICTYAKLIDSYNNEIINVYNTHLDLNFDFVKIM